MVCRMNEVMVYIARRQCRGGGHNWPNRVFIRHADADAWGKKGSLNYTVEAIPMDLADDTYTASLLKMAQ